MRLKDKVAIITGAASGFGEGMARRFAEEGAKVVVADLNAKGAERVAAEIGQAAIAVTTDVSSRSEVDEMVYAAKSAFGRVDIMVNNAGYTHRNGDLLKVDEATLRPDHRHQHEGDLPFDAGRRADHGAAGRRRDPHDRLDRRACRPRPGLTWYNASKGWTITATKSMAVELAPKNIRVNCLCPVAGETGMLEKFMGEDTPEKRAQFRASIPLGRLSTPLDIANAALWLCSDEAEFITGVALEVDGGRCI